MPLYEYTCKNCNKIFDLFFPLKEWNITPDCPDCGGKGKKNIMTGGIQESEPNWLQDAVLQENIAGDGEKPIVTRQELNRYMKDNNLHQGTSRMV